MRVVGDRRRTGGKTATIGEAAISARQDIKRDWSDHYWWSHDGVRLHARIYPGPEGCDAAPPILCLPGLARNARDFEALAPHIAAGRRVVVAEFRGRGESAYAKDPMTYVPLTYVQDIIALLDEMEIERFATVGTSLGGLVAMLLPLWQNGRDKGTLEVGVLEPVVEQVEPLGQGRDESILEPVVVEVAPPLLPAGARHGVAPSLEARER